MEQVRAPSRPLAGLLIDKINIHTLITAYQKRLGVIGGGLMSARPPLWNHNKFGILHEAFPLNRC